MAIYHLSLKAIQRSKGRSSTASAAYRSSAKITDQRTGQTYDYTRKKGVEARAIFTPDGSKISREELWNLAEGAEKRKDGIPAREYELALPCELDKAQRIELAKNFCVMLVERYGVAADVALHAPTREGDQRNFHAHVQITTRRLVNGSLGPKSDFELSGTDRKKKGLKSQKEELEDIREEWEQMVNASLEAAGRPERVSRKSLIDQGISRPPTVHMGVAATAMERRGIQTDRGDLNRWPILRRLYSELREMQKNLRVLEADLARMQEEKGNGAGREISGVGEKGGRGPEKADTTAGHPQRGYAPQAADAGSKRPVQPDKIAAGRAKQAPESAGGSKAGHPGNQGSAGRNVEIPRPNLPDAQRISGKGQAGGLTSSQGRGREAGENGGANRDDLGRSGEAGRSSWLERWRRLEEDFIRRLIEYRTIGDLLAMNRRREEEKIAEEEEMEAKKRPQGPK